MKKIIVTVVVFAAFCLSAVSSSLAADDLKIGIFDIQKILAESKTVQGYRQKIEKDLEPKKKAFADKQQLASHLEEKMKIDGPSMSTSDRRIAEDRLSRAMLEVKMMNEDINLEYQRINKQLTQQAVDEIFRTAGDIGSNEDYSVIFEKNQAGVVFLKNRFDITEKIIKAYDSK
ncbi:MAG: OmpH family outer membrane protein [Dissulfurispiraceae bacterium]